MSTEAAEADDEAAPAPRTLEEALAGASVVVCCGSGGVGKTTIAAVLGMEEARRGRRAVVVTIDPARRLADALGLPDGLGPEPRLLDLGLGKGAKGELWAMMLDTAAMFDKVVRENALDAEQAERIVENRFYRNIAGSLSGTQEYMASEALHELHDDERFDLVVVDTPPSRNALDFLDAPGVLARFLDHKVFKVLMLSTRSGLRVLNAAAQPVLRAIGRVVGSDVLADAVAFFQAFAGMEAGFRERAEEVIELLRSTETRFVLVASPRHDTVDEALWFAEQLESQGLGVAATVINRAHPSFGSVSSDEAAARAAASTDSDLAALWSARYVSGCRAHRSPRCRCCPVTCTTSKRSPRSRRTSSRTAVERRGPPTDVRRTQDAPDIVGAVHILLATDADWIVDDVTAALGGPETSFTVCREGYVVSDVVARRTPDVAIFDLQIGTMGGMAVTMALRLDESAGVLPHVPVLMLLDRRADLHLARRSGAEGWLIKPLDPLRLRRAALTVAGGGTYTEGLTTTAAPITDGDRPEAILGDLAPDSPEGEPATSG